MVSSSPSDGAAAVALDDRKQQESQQQRDLHCPICLEDMDLYDASYPMLCPTGCGYNFCFSCAERLVASSQDGYEMASDGSRQVKIWLQCPQCRGDISPTIRDTILIRRHCRATLRYASVPDSELSAAEIRIKHAGAATAADLRRALRGYTGSEQGQWLTHVDSADDDDPDVSPEPPAVGNGLDAIDRGTTGEREAVEAGDRKGDKVRTPLCPVDVTLFSGLEDAMTEDEQRYVSEMMTSGDPDKLAQAAQILAGISENIIKGIAPGQRSANAGASSSSAAAAAAAAAAGPPSRPRPRNAKQQQRRNVRQGRSNHSGAVRRAGKTAMTEVERVRQKEAELAEMRKKNPLPARMPRYATIDAFDPDLPPRRCPLTFVDNEWDGSVADAYTRLRVGRDGKVGRDKISPSSMHGVCNVLTACAACGSGQEVLETLSQVSSPMSRVIVANSQADAARRGIFQGDVLTHVNGERFGGTAEDLRGIIAQIWRQSGQEGTINLVVNAEPCTAEALRLRSLVV